LIIVIIVLLGLSALFSGAEIAFVSANKLGIEVLKNKGSKKGNLIAQFYDNPRLFMSSMLVGNNIVLVMFTIFASELVEPFFWSIFDKDSLSIILIVTVIITVVVLIFGEFLPKIFFRMFSNESLFKLAYVLKAFVWLLFVPTWFMTKLSNFVLKYIFRAPQEQVDNALSKIDLEEYINESVSEEEDIDKEILTNALNLGSLKVRDVLIPRNEIVSIDVSDTVEESIQLFKKHKISRIIVFEGEMENIIGYIHHQQLLNNPKKLNTLVMPINFVPDVMGLQELMKEFIVERTNIAVVVDEFGGVTGLITLEDILEEIFGEIEDEHDETGLIEEKISNEEYLFAGRHEIDYLNEKYPNLLLPEGDYQTLSGYIVTSEEDIPTEGDEIEIGKYLFILESVSDTKIERVRIKRLYAQHSDNEDKQ
jgi:CBS domain containing-hemolysin-like protein